MSLLRISVLLGMLLPSLASAQIYTTERFGTECITKGKCTIEQIFVLIDAIVQWGAAASGAIALLFFVIGGVWMIFSGGNSSRVERGKDIIVGSSVSLFFILGSWLVVDFALDALGSKTRLEDAAASAEFAKEQEAAAEAAGCNSEEGLQALALQNKVPYPAQEDGRLREAKNCLLRDASIVSRTDQSQLFTVELTNKACNYTRGETICGECAHAANSCHYGGSTGEGGALAVDFNAKNPSYAGEDALYDLIKVKVGSCNASARFEEVKDKKTGYSTFHTHVWVAGGNCQ